MTDRLGDQIAAMLERRADVIGGGPPYTADELVVAGRAAVRRRTARRWVLTAVVAGVVVAAPSVVKAVGAERRPEPAASTSPRALPANCTVQRLPVPPSAVMNMVTGMDSTGRYVVGRTNPGGSSGRLDVLLWNQGALAVVTVPGEEQLPNDVNGSGAVVGNRGLITKEGWLYRDGAVTILPGQRPTSAEAVNDRGEIVGSVGLGQPVVWRSPTAAPTALALPDRDWEGQASNIADDGTIVGTLNPKGAPNQNVPYVWSPDGTLRELPLPVVDGRPASRAWARSIDGDWVAGAAQVDRETVVVGWNLRTGAVWTMAGVDLGAHSVSGDGWVVGANLEGQAMVASSADSAVLPDLHDHDRRIANVAIAITRDGTQIAGNALVAANRTEPALWRCAQQPR